LEPRVHDAFTRLAAGVVRLETELAGVARDASVYEPVTDDELAALRTELVPVVYRFLDAVDPLRRAWFAMTDAIGDLTPVALTGDVAAPAAAPAPAPVVEVAPAPEPEPEPEPESVVAPAPAVAVAPEPAAPPSVPAPPPAPFYSPFAGAAPAPVAPPEPTAPPPAPVAPTAPPEPPAVSVPAPAPAEPTDAPTYLDTSALPSLGSAPDSPELLLRGWSPSDLFAEISRRN
jgi:outer membrane biosynthesis protein TonB